MRNEKICTLEYIEITRTIKNEQLIEKAVHSLALYVNKIEIKDKTFALKNIFDISYRPVSGKKGMLYLHTNQGVFAFLIESDPNPFIQACKKLM